MVLTGGGVPIFHYSPDGSRRMDELLSGFLTAITSFASEFGEKSVQSLSFEGSELLYEHTEVDLLCIFLADTNAPKKILRAILRDLSRKFIDKYAIGMDFNLAIEEAYRDFKYDVERALSYYDGVLMITSSLSSFVVPSLKKDAYELAADAHGLLDQFHRDFGGSGNRILDAVNGNDSIYDISESLGIEEHEVQEAIEYLAIWGVLQISKIAPELKAEDARFDAFLDLIGLPQKDYQLLKRAMPLCDGTKPLAEISNKLGVTSERLYEVLNKLGDEVQWKQLHVTDLPNQKA
jgi:DNA-binding Lrp family transcriptional regulator